uniref:sodium-coupled monocarboxylate transporter 1-like n=1 Tax=Styela clava TaxID=7725 RepID=UPI00193A0380|nr:sodium-coupled monocarboxylate transporter 1-like [Styela clava]
MDNSEDYFHPADFVIFGAMLLISTIIGIFFAVRDRSNNSTDNYYFAGRKANPIPVALSLIVSFVSAIAVIGLPVEVYLHGTTFAWNTIAQLIATIIAILYYIPVYHRLRLKSVYEYLELRFHVSVRKVASLLAMLNLILYLGVVIYMPSLTLSAVTPLSLYWAIALTSVICTFYTAVGGMKAVIWTDVFQSGIMMAGMLSVFIQGVITLGGIEPLREAADRGGRSNFLTFTFDPRTRSTFWTVAFGLGLNACFETGCNQVYIQRYLSCKTVKTARIALLLTLAPGFFFTLISVANGLVMYAFFEGCDPHKAGIVEKVDQIIPRLALQIFQHAPGMAGLFVSAAYCGTLSSVSSGVNALSALTMMDFISPFFPNMSPRIKVWLSKGLTLCFGLLVMALAYIISFSDANIIEIVVSISGFIGGPMIGIFTMGLFFPWINYLGALVGLILGWAAATWVGLTAMYVTQYEGSNKQLQISIDNCTALPTSATDMNMTTTYMTPTTTSFEGSGYNFTTTESYNPRINTTFYSMSPFLYGVWGFLVTVFFGHVISLISGFNKPSEANPDLFMPFLPIKAFRFGVPKRSKRKIEVEEENESPM